MHRRSHLHCASKKGPSYGYSMGSRGNSTTMTFTYSLSKIPSTTICRAKVLSFNLAIDCLIEHAVARGKKSNAHFSLFIIHNSKTCITPSVPMIDPWQPPSHPRLRSETASASLSSPLTQHHIAHRTEDNHSTHPPLHIPVPPCPPIKQTILSYPVTIMKTLFIETPNPRSTQQLYHPHPPL